MKKISVVILALALSIHAMAQQMPAFIQKGNLSIGAQIAHTRLESDNSDILLLLNPLTVSGKATLLSPSVQFAYRDNRAVGLRLSFFDTQLELDNLTIDLLNDDMQFEIDSFTAAMSTFGGSVYHRSFYGLDSKNRLAAFTEFALAFTGGQSDYGQDGSYSKSFKSKLSFSPGILFFVMNNVAASFSLSMASISYNSVKCLSGGEVTGQRSKFGTKLGPELTGINFGVSVFFL